MIQLELRHNAVRTGLAYHEGGYVISALGINLGNGNSITVIGKSNVHYVLTAAITVDKVTIFRIDHNRIVMLLRAADKSKSSAVGNRAIGYGIIKAVRKDARKGIVQRKFCATEIVDKQVFIGRHAVRL